MSILLMAALLLGTAGVALAETQNDDMDIFTYAPILFGFEDSDYYPYLPTFFDPVNYYGYISLTGGVKDDTYYAVYPCDTAEWLMSYFDYLAYWGYTGAPMECDLPGVEAWHMTSTESSCEGRPLMQTLDVYFAEDHGVMAVACSYLDAWIYDEWLAHPDMFTYDHFDPSHLPSTLWLSEDVSIMVEEFFLTDQLFVNSEEDLSLWPYDAELLQFRDLQIRSMQKTGASMTQHILHVDSGSAVNKAQLLCVKVSCGSSAQAEVLHSLRAALAEANDRTTEYADCTDVPMLLLTQSEKDPLLFTLADEESASDLWLVFPPSVYRTGDVLRLYLCMEDENDPWIGDLRDWQYVNFQVKPDSPW